MVYARVSRGLMRRAIDAIKARLGAFVAQSERRLHEIQVPFYVSLPAPVLRATVTRAFEAVVADFAVGGTTHIVTLLGTLGRERSQQGIPVVDVLTGLNIGFQAITDDFAVLFSGVAAFDAEVAGYLVRAAQATVLLGATPILVGLSAAAAQTLVGLGDDGGVALGPLLTLADLESGLRHALSRLGVAWTATRELH